MHSIRRTKHTGRYRTVSGSDWPLLHVLSGNDSRGFTVYEDVCNGHHDKATDFADLAKAEAHFATLAGEELRED